MVWLKRAIKVKLGGFTLIEMVVCLAISLSLIMLGTVEIASYREQLILNNTAKEIKSSIEQAARFSTIKHETVTLIYQPQTKILVFVGDGFSQQMQIASTITVYGLHGRTVISAKGMLAPLTITIEDGHHSQKIKLQMQWGRAIDE
ncbi:prepilin-type N-terminal cleavage/methylation domain-containing protein [Lactobacillus sp. ESL0701]|uniref:prepilin-type N-terminal cleavage/methylation domain-containing protein n=1 Tax=Lactobacillus sp. ESL0701 TaxID=2983217 RepID=UPI0023F8A121|nr:prepilin-type N-terminal cleavage/methylation domain-containing protein [Lactobacillus sp. ESL0701]MDF7672201.1 prepilin-type N-terminal cleavage/methylation domain-containing protein [Lactobacillus sp. ESL0701]